MATPRPEPAPPMTRRRVMAVGLLGAAMGLGALSLSVGFLFIPWRESNGIGGVMVPLAIAIPILALTVWALLPLRLGDTPHTAAVQARIWLGLGVIPVPIIAAGIIRDHSAWSALAILPVVVDAALFRSAAALHHAVNLHSTPPADRDTGAPRPAAPAQ